MEKKINLYKNLLIIDIGYGKLREVSDEGLFD
jgi:hypothetical protein